MKKLLLINYNHN